MALPTATDVYEYLEGFGIDNTDISSQWIDKRITNNVVPYIEETIRQSLDSETEYEEYLSGNGNDTLVLSRRPVIAVLSLRLVQTLEIEYSISLTAIELIAAAGIIKSIRSFDTALYQRPLFPRGNKNIYVSYTAGYATIPNDLNDAIIMLAAEMALSLKANRTGGGNLSVQNWNRQWGDMGKYTHIRNDLKRQAHSILKRYFTGVAST